MTTSLITLTDPATGSSALISPVGASILALELSGKKVIEPVSANGPEFYSGVVMAPWSSRIAQGKYELSDGRSFQLPINEPARNNALHGLVYNQSFEIERSLESAVEMYIEISESAWYPFHLKLAISYELEEGGLFVSFAVRNISSEKAPFGIGFHPYLSMGWAKGPVLIQSAAGSVLNLNENMIATGRASTASSLKDLSVGRQVIAAGLDDDYTDLEFRKGVATTKLVTEDGSGVEVWQEDIFKHVVIYTTDSFEAEAGLISAVAIEPSTSEVNAFNSKQDLLWLEPNQTRSGSWGIKLLK
jgi:aldose 1-epimerase